MQYSALNGWLNKLCGSFTHACECHTRGASVSSGVCYFSLQDRTLRSATCWQCRLAATRHRLLLDRKRNRFSLEYFTTSFSERQHAPVWSISPSSSRLDKIEIHENDRVHEYRSDKPEAKNIKHVMLGSARSRIVPRN
jgi:hypothetical protein